MVRYREILQLSDHLVSKKIKVELIFYNRYELPVGHYPVQNHLMAFHQTWNQISTPYHGLLCFTWTSQGSRFIAPGAPLTVVGPRQEVKAEFHTPSIYLLKIINQASKLLKWKTLYSPILANIPFKWQKQRGVRACGCVCVKLWFMDLYNWRSTDYQTSEFNYHCKYLGV